MHRRGKTRNFAIVKEETKNPQLEEKLQLVSQIARRYAGKGLDLDDLIGEGHLALAEAKADETKKQTARRIHHAMRQALAAHGYPAKLSDKQSKVAAKVNRARIALEQTLGRKPSIGEIAEATGINEKTVGESIKMRSRLLSADAPLTHRQSTTLSDVIEDKTVVSSEETMTRNVVQRQIEEAIIVLDEREQAVIKAYFGIGEEPATLAQIAERLGIKRERARQIRDRALRRMRKMKIEN